MASPPSTVSIGCDTDIDQLQDPSQSPPSFNEAIRFPSIAQSSLISFRNLPPPYFSDHPKQKINNDNEIKVDALYFESYGGESFKLTFVREPDCKEIVVDAQSKMPLDAALELYANLTGQRLLSNLSNCRLFIDIREIMLFEKRKSTLESLGIDSDTFVRVLVTATKKKFKLVLGVRYELSNSLPCYISTVLDENVFCVILPCGHVISPESLKMAYKTDLNGSSGTDFKCSNLIISRGGSKKCGYAIAYEAVRDLAELSSDESKEIEVRQSKIFFRMNDYKTCLNCRNSMFRAPDQADLFKVSCTQCQKVICWHCGRVWRGKSEYLCGNNGCKLSSEGLNAALSSCARFDISERCKNVPKLRSCPNPECNFLIEHIDKCKHMVCEMCKTNFCLVCLKICGSAQKKPSPGEWNNVCGGAYDLCPTGVAPIQNF